MQKSHTFASPTSQHPNQSVQKSVPAQLHLQIHNRQKNMTKKRKAINSCSFVTATGQAMKLRLNGTSYECHKIIMEAS